MCQHRRVRILNRNERPKGTTRMWQRLLDRFVPVLDDEPSRLDLLDGVTSTSSVAGADRGASPVTEVPTDRMK